MQPFKTFGIQFLSPSSLTLWREAPAFWALRYLHKYKEETAPSAARGRVVEHAYTRWLYRRDTPMDDLVAQAKINFDIHLQGEVGEDYEEEKAKIEPMIRALIEGTVKHEEEHGPLGKLIASQLRVEHWLEGVSVPIRGYIDYVFETGKVADLKTGRSCPSAVKPVHARQVGFYLAARKSRDGAIIYATPKKFACYAIDPGSIDTLLEEMRRDALSLQNFLTKFDTPGAALKALPANLEHYYWDDESKRLLDEKLRDFA